MFRSEFKHVILTGPGEGCGEGSDGPKYASCCRTAELQPRAQVEKLFCLFDASCSQNINYFQAKNHGKHQ